MILYGITVKENLLKKLLNSAVLAIIFVGQFPLVATATKIDEKSASQNELVFTVPRAKAVKTMTLDATAYSSRPAETDASPYITADGSVVRDGYIATNVLPIGTKVRLPKLFGDKIFEVRDRMNARYTYRLDVWMPDLAEARKFGIKRKVQVEIIEMGNGKKNWEQWKGKGKELHQVGKYGPPAPPLPQPHLVAISNDSV